MKKVTILVMCVLILILFTACGSEEEVVTEEVENIVVATQAVEQQDIDKRVQITGNLAGSQNANIVPKAAGQVLEIPVQVGQQVNRGDVLMRLDDEDMALALASARAGLATAEANLASAEAGVREEELTQVRAAYEDAKRIYERMERLYEEEAISLRQLEEAELGLLQAETNLEMAEKGAREEDLEAARAQVEQTRAEVNRAESALRNAVITAPIAGRVASISVEVGEMAGSGGPVMRLVSVDSVEVEVNLPESYVNNIKQGDEVQVEVAAASSEPLIGVVKYVSPAADLQTRQFPIKVSIENSEGVLRPGMFASLNFATERQEDALVVPKEAVVNNNGQQVVYVVEEDQVHERTITTGVESANMIQVLTGVELGEEIVVKGQHRLGHGSSVKVVNGGDNK
ncbi:multidrug efflux pump subunit AcrA (membrane-fusion protein) [Desulfitispora alkaliphila]|uniref:efflux RND transporter periplasmic adaptor subunit n=1 Tax=Desulfitispora alkaliphila TaxID=622674 RepID=UPI003D238ADE